MYTKKLARTKQPQTLLMVSKTYLGYKVAAAGYFLSNGMLWDALNGKMISPSVSNSVNLDSEGYSASGTGQFSVPTNVWKLDKNWTLLFTHRTWSDAGSPFFPWIFNSTYNGGNGDNLGVAGPDDRVSFIRMYANNTGSFSGHTGPCTANPAWDVDKWSAFMWSHPSTATGTFHAPFSQMAIAGNSPFGGATDELLVRPGNAAYRLGLFILLEGAAPSSAYSEFSKNPWSAFTPVLLRFPTTVTSSLVEYGIYRKKINSNTQAASLNKLASEYARGATYSQIAGRPPVFGAYVRTGADTWSVTGYTKDGVVMNSVSYGNASAPSMEYAIGSLWGGGQHAILVQFRTVFSTNVVRTFNSNGASQTNLAIDASGNLGIRDDSANTTQYVTGLIEGSTHCVVLAFDEFGTSTIHFDGKQVGTLTGIPVGKNELTATGVYMIVSWRDRLITKQQADLLSENPWRVFEKQTKVYPLAFSVIPPSFGLYKKKVQRASQPKYALTINRHNSLTRGLTALVNGGPGLKGDLVSGQAAWGTTGSAIATQDGQSIGNPTAGTNGVYWDRSSNTATRGPTSLYPSSQVLTAVVVVTPLAYDSSANFFQSSAGSDGFTLYSRFSDGTLQATLNDGTNRLIQSSSGKLLLGKRNVLALRCDGSTLELFNNGVSLGTTATGGTSIFYDSSFSQVILGGSLNPFGVNGASCVPHFAGLWNRPLSNQELREISNNPWQLFAPENKQYALALESAPSGIPILSLASYTSLTQTTVKPRVTITF